MADENPRVPVIELQTEEVTVRGEKYIVQEMDGVRFQEYIIKLGQPGVNRSKAALTVAYSVVDETGKLFFEPEDIPALGLLPWEWLDQIIVVANRLSKLTTARDPEAEAEAEKN